MKAAHCDECARAMLRWYPYRRDIVPDLKCAKGHKPRFYQLVSPSQPDWGWKRVCVDFERSNAGVHEPA